MAGDHGKRKKHHDKDKYYHLAKEQGLRSRAAFKLTQINRKFPSLEASSSAVLDLCAAPGGWTQVAARTCPKSTSIISVDILPIRPFKGFPNITTLIGDITTEKCKADIRNAVLQGCGGRRQTVDVVLHDGAPNIGAEYGKDAYEQNELALHALRCATQHLKRGGTFITKIYRSRDYASYHWLLQQLFGLVNVFKPKASRQQSAEIFLVAQDYKAPAKIDPRLLDPKHVFEAVEGQTTGGGDDAGASNIKVDIFHKNYDKPKRQRGGYDMEFFDAAMRHLTPVCKFVESSFKDAVQILGRSTGMEFSCDTCKQKQPSAANTDDSKCACSFLLHHPLTTTEVQTAVCDLQVLNKSDFKALLAWRAKMQQALEARQEDAEDDDSDASSDKEAEDDKDEEEKDSDAEEKEIQSEIAEMKQRRMREKKRLRKKERAKSAKRRRQVALGMDLNAIEVPDNDKLFSLATISNRGDLLATAEVNLDQATDEQVFGPDDEEDIVVGKLEEDAADVEDAERLRRRERDLDEAYELYLQSTKSAAAKRDTKQQKRSKRVMRQKVLEEEAEDQEMLLTQRSSIGYDTMAYAKLLAGGSGRGDKDSDASDDDKDDSDDDDSDDGFHAEPVTPEAHAALQRQKNLTANKNPLIHKLDDEPASVKAARWFSNPLFESIQKTAALATGSAQKQVGNGGGDSDDAGDGNDNGIESESEAEKMENDSKPPATKGDLIHNKKRKAQGISADDVLASMPKTDKQKRHEKRLKQMAKDERKQARRAKNLGEEESEFKLAPPDHDKDIENDEDNLAHLSEAKRKQILEAREQIKAGMGKALDDDLGNTNSKSFEVVRMDGEEDDRIPNRPLPVKDTRKYDSDHEDYDSDDYAETLSLGTMILRRSKEKALVDASYNRYAWNDPADLPEWFVDDEKKFYRPQLPIPPALLAKMKEKMMALAAKPIQKVAEARARKNKRARLKLAAAKKKAEAVANATDMSDTMKLKAISKALRGQEAKIKPGKTYVVAKKGRGAAAGKPGGGAGKGVKLVDKRMKNDKRAMERAEKKRKKGKQGGLTGTKRRRHHS